MQKTVSFAAAVATVGALCGAALAQTAPSPPVVPAQTLTSPQMAQATPAAPPVDRAKILVEPGVFGVFATYRVRPDYYRVSPGERMNAAAEVLAVVEKHKAGVVVDAYLTRGLGASADYFLRVHAYDLAKAQAFLNDFRATRFGMFSEVTENLVGITKTLNYITKQKSEALNAGLFAASYTDKPPRYALMVPVKKSAAWWNKTEADRLKEIETHTAPTLQYLVNVKRKLYHSTGIADTDFITYFEVEDVGAFNNLMIALASVPENLYHTRWGSPTIIGTIQSFENVVKSLSTGPSAAF